MGVEKSLLRVVLRGLLIYLITYLCYKLLPKFPNMSKMILDHAEKLRFRKLDYEHIHEVISITIIKHYLLFLFVDYKWIKVLHSLLNLDAKYYSRKYYCVWGDKNLCGSEEEIEISHVNNHGKICLTSGYWTAYTSKRHICLTIHCIDKNWKLNSIILSFCKMEPSYLGIELARNVFDYLKD